MNRGSPYSIYYIDWLDQHSTDQYSRLSKEFKVQRVDLLDNMADTYRYCASISPTPWFFLLNGLTDYTDFDFNYVIDPSQDRYMHVFGSGTWLGSKDHALRVDPKIKYIEAFPDLHFVETKLAPYHQLLDIVYISNGEPLAEYHYQFLTKTVKTGNKIHRIDRVNGRSEAYKAAARSSTTPWFFTVFAKLEVDPNFDWTWYPDYETGPEHYIFHAINPVNNLSYGHMAMIAYNKMLTLSTDQPGLDFTMSKPNRVVPLNSGIAKFNQDPIVTWRTAFREVLKLKSFLKDNEDPAAMIKIDAWLARGEGTYGEWSIRGADDAVEYFDICRGDPDRIKLSYEWAWLDGYFKRKYSL